MNLQVEIVVLRNRTVAILSANITGMVLPANCEPEPPSIYGSFGSSQYICVYRSPTSLCIFNYSKGSKMLHF